jgi:hypothetical protein
MGGHDGAFLVDLIMPWLACSILSTVMAGLDPAIHVLRQVRKSWMPGT